MHVEITPRAILELLVLHEDEVPDLDKAVAIFLGRSGRAAPDVITMVVKDLGAGTARAGWAHHPEIIARRDADDAVFGHADLFPDLGGLVISMVDRHVETVLVDLQFLGDQLPSKGDRLGLEIVAKAEIPQHLKERVVARGIAHIVEVIVFAARPHAFLGGRCALVIPRLDTGEQVLELHHTRICEHQRRIVARDKRAGIHDGVALLFKVVQEGRADVVQRAHGRALWGFSSVGFK